MRTTNEFFFVDAMAIKISFKAKWQQIDFPLQQHVNFHHRGQKFVFGSRLYVIIFHMLHTVCPGRSDPPEKNILIYLHQKVRFIPFFNYHDILG